MGARHLGRSRGLRETAGDGVDQIAFRDDRVHTDHDRRHAGPDHLAGGLDQGRLLVDLDHRDETKILEARVRSFRACHATSIRLGPAPQ